MIIIIITTTIIKNMQSKLYTIQFSHCLATGCTASPRTAILEPTGFADFTRLRNFAELTDLMEKD